MKFGRLLNVIKEGVRFLDLFEGLWQVMTARAFLVVGQSVFSNRIILIMERINNIIEIRNYFTFFYLSDIIDFIGYFNQFFAKSSSDENISMIILNPRIQPLQKL